MKYYFLLLLSIITISSFAQNDRPIEVGLETQFYPAGVISTIKGELGLGTYYKHSLDIRLGYNRTRRNDWGKHGDERGGGMGLSVGYRYYITKPMKGVFISGRADLWALSIDYRDIGEDQVYGTDDDFNFGNTKTLVFQPTGIIGYKFDIPIKNKDNFLFLTPHLAGGWEINTQTKGEKVGQGRIILLGLDVMIRI